MGNSPARSVVDVGSVIADTYTIEALIGRGGMGAVFLASHRRLPGKKVAIKVLHAEITDDELLIRFRREAHIASQLNHPNIVDVNDFNVTPEGTPYLVLEYLHGESLAQRIKPGPMPLDQVVSIIRQVGSAIAAAHRGGIVHRDLKPQNIFLVPKEVDGRIIEIAKVLDFGISKMRDSGTVKTQESTLLGTPQYMAPEQATGQHASVDDRTDIFALGAIVYEMLSGEPAFSGANIPEVVFKVVYEEPPPLASRVPGLPPAVLAAVARAMAKPAADRFPSVGAFIEALTGQPLLHTKTAAIAPPEIGFATGSKHTGNDAFAQTMGSVDHGTSPAAVPAVNPIDNTLPSQGGGVPTVASPARAVAAAAAAAAATAAPRRRPPFALIGGGLVLTAAAGVIAYLVMRPPAAAPAPAAPVVAVATSDGGVGSAAPPPPIDAGVATAPPPPIDAQEATAPPDAGAPGPVRPPRDAGIRRPPDAAPAAPEGPEDEAVTKNIDTAESALAAGQADRAERLANTVISSPDARPRQRARAHFVRGVVKCTQQNDQEAAVIELRNLRGIRGSRPLQVRLIDTCKRAGVELR